MEVDSFDEAIKFVNKTLGFWQRLLGLALKLSLAAFCLACVFSLVTSQLAFAWLAKSLST